MRLRSQKKKRSLKLSSFVDDITALVKGRNKEVAEMTENMKRLKEEVQKEGLKLSVTGKR